MSYQLATVFRKSAIWEMLMDTVCIVKQILSPDSLAGLCLGHPDLLTWLPSGFRRGWRLLSFPRAQFSPMIFSYSNLPTLIHLWKTGSCWRLAFNVRIIILIKHAATEAGQRFFSLHCEGNRVWGSGKGSSL